MVICRVKYRGSYHADVVGDLIGTGFLIPEGISEDGKITLFPIVDLEDFRRRREYTETDWNLAACGFGVLWQVEKAPFLQLFGYSVATIPDMKRLESQRGMEILGYYYTFFKTPPKEGGLKNLEGDIGSMAPSKSELIGWDRERTSSFPVARRYAMARTYAAARESGMEHSKQLSGEYVEVIPFYDINQDLKETVPYMRPAQPVDRMDPETKVNLNILRLV